MTIEELYQKLCALGIPEHRYYLNGVFGSKDDNEKIALKIEGKHFLDYEVSYKERGEIHILRKFLDRDDAFSFFIEKLVEERKLF